MENDLRKALEGAVFCGRKEGPQNGGAAVVEITFNTHDGGMDLFNLIERIMSGG